MSDHIYLSKAFPETPVSELERLRSEDPKFEEVCRDYLELSRLEERLSTSGAQHIEGVAAVSVSLAELKTELTELLQSAGLKHSLRGD